MYKFCRTIFVAIRVKSDITNSSVNNLTIVTSMSAGASLLSLFTKAAPTFTIFGVMYFLILAVIGWTATKLLTTIARTRSYEISDIEYDKDIK